MAPSNVQAQFPSDSCGDEVRVTWDAPAYGPGVQEYLVSCTSTAGTSTSTVQNTDAIVGPLETSGVQYTCSVTASNEAGVSASIAAAPFITGYVPGKF